MGWSFEHKNPGQKINKRMYVEKLFRDDTYEVKAVSVVGSTAYAAVLHKPKDYVFCCVVRLIVRKCEIGYKMMSEDMHPYYYAAPAKILNMLSETDNKCSLDWRKGCKEYQRIHALFNTIKEDTIIETDKPVHYGKHGDFSVFKCYDKKKSHYMAYNSDGSYSLLVKLSKANILSYGFKIKETKV